MIVRRRSGRVPRDKADAFRDHIGTHHELSSKASQ